MSKLILVPFADYLYRKSLGYNFVAVKKTIYLLKLLQII